MQKIFLFGNHGVTILHTIRVKPKHRYDAEMLERYLNKRNQEIRGLIRAEVHTPCDGTEATHTRQITFLADSEGVDRAITSILEELASLDQMVSRAQYQKDLLDMVEK